jgi:hypothetical protein
MNPLLKSILAVLAGFLAVVVLSTATDAVLEAAGIFPPPSGGLFITWMLALAFAYRTLYNIVGGYITASIAPANPVKHAFILGCIGTIAGAAGVVIGWDLSEHWYPIALMVEAVPTCWLGGKLKLRSQLQTA